MAPSSVLFLFQFASRATESWACSTIEEPTLFQQQLLVSSGYCTFLEKGVFVAVGICNDVVKEGFSVC